MALVLIDGLDDGDILGGAVGLVNSEAPGLELGLADGESNGDAL